MRDYYTISRYDVGKRFLRIGDRTISLGGTLGRVQSQDVGKRIYDPDKIPQVENQEQLTKRLEG